jgi:hypothetical protein
MNRALVHHLKAPVIASLVAVTALAQGAPPTQAPARIPTEPELVGAIPYEVASRNGIVQYLMIQVGDGGSGPYKSVLVGDPNLKTHTLYRPKDLRPFGAARKLPVVAYGNGACRNGSYEVRNLLTEVASHGFLVLAIGPAASAATGLVNGSSQSKQLLDAVDWAIAENARSGSDFFGRIDTAKVAVMGQSCGGLQAIEVSGDPRITTTILLNSGILSRPMPTPATPTGGGPGLPGMPNVTKDPLAQLHAPIAYFIGGKSDIAYPNAIDDFARIDKVPIFMGNQDVGHYPATYLEPRGGAFGVAASAWLRWQLQGDQTAARMFTGQKCGLCTDPKWTVEKKRIE